MARLRRRSSARITLLVLALGSNAGLAGSLRAQGPACDSTVQTKAADPSRYRLRDGDRCEGVFVQVVAGSSSLRVASLVEHFETFVKGSPLPLRIEWSPPNNAPVILRAYSLKSGVYYRMETVRPLTGVQYIWPTTVLRTLQIGKADLGIVGTAMVAVGGTAHEVYVPLRVTQRLLSPHSPVYQVTLWSSVELAEVFVSVAALDAHGNPAKYLERDRNLGYGFYPAERGIPIELPALITRGFYRVAIGATRKSGGSATTTFLLYHDAAPQTGTGR